MVLQSFHLFQVFFNWFTCIQSRISFKNLLYWINWFSFIYLSFVIIDAFHIPFINLTIKNFVFLTSSELSSHIQNKALHYFRSAGLAIDPIHAGIKLSFLLAIALHQFKTFKYSWLLIPLLFITIWLTGSRSAIILSLVGIIIWIAFNRDFKLQIKTLAKYTSITFLLIVVFMLNNSFSQVSHIS